MNKAKRDKKDLMTTNNVVYLHADFCFFSERNDYTKSRNEWMKQNNDVLPEPWATLPVK